MNKMQWSIFLFLHNTSIDDMLLSFLFSIYIAFDDAFNVNTNPWQWKKGIIPIKQRAMTMEERYNTN